MENIKLIFILLFLVFSLNLMGQTTTLLDTNNISATINSSSLLFYNYPSHPGFEVPKGGGNNTIFISNIWIGGLDSTRQLHIAGERYGMNWDYFYGPISNDYVSAPYPTKYNRLWKVD